MKVIKHHGGRPLADSQKPFKPAILLMINALIEKDSKRCNREIASVTKPFLLGQRQVILSGNQLQRLHAQSGEAWLMHSTTDLSQGSSFQKCGPGCKQIQGVKGAWKVESYSI